MTEQFIGKKKLNLSLLIKIVKDTGQGFIDDSVTRLSGSLAYATLFSIIPFLSLLVTIGVALHMDLANQLYIQLEPIVGAEVITKAWANEMGSKIFPDEYAVATKVVEIRET